MPLSLSGTGVALITPFRPDASIDWAALDRLVDHVIDGGVDYVVALGTTGEPITLSGRECRQVFDRLLHRVAGRVPVVAGMFGGNDTRALEAKIRDYAFDGFAAIMSSSPAYNKPTQEGIYQHYSRVADAAPLPVLIYNVPGRTASHVTAATILRLAAQGADRFVGVKDASGDLRQAMQLAAGAPAGFHVLCGEDALVLPFLAAGGGGGISVVANALPGAFSALVRAARGGDFATARSLNAPLLALDHWLYCENNPAGIKAACEALGLCDRQTRLPILPFTAEHLPQLRRALEGVRHAVG